MCARYCAPAPVYLKNFRKLSGMENIIKLLKYRLKMQIKHVIFDYNGTITNDAVIGYKSCNHLLEFYGVPTISFERFKQTFILPWIEFYVANGVSRDHIEIPTHQAEYRKMHTMLAKKELNLNESVKETLEFLKSKGISTGLLTVRNKDDLHNELSSLGITDHFDVIIGEDHLHKDGIEAKKRTEEMIEKLNIKDPKQVLFVGDMIIDIKTARENGFVSAVVPNGWQSKERLLAEKPDIVFNKFSEIKQFFE